MKPLSTRYLKRSYWLSLSLSLLVCLPAAFAAGRADKINTASANPPLTTQQLIEPSTLAGHRTGTLLLLHVNDIHDIIKAPLDHNLGGMAYISGYVHKMRTERKDLLMLDAGDLFQKGDTLGVASKGEVTCRALAAISCDLTIPGNHDFCYGVAQYRKDLKAAGLDCVCAGMEYTDNHESVFPPFKEFKIGNVRIAVIGGTANTSQPKEDGRTIRKFDNAELGQRIHQIAAELRPRTDLLVGLLHNGTFAGQKIAALAPEVQLVICGHTDEVTEKPILTPSGALVLEVGRAGQWVGKLDAVVDLDEKKLGRYTYQLISMDHEKIAPDQKLAAQIQAWEKQWCPEADTPLAQAPDGLKPGGPGQPGDLGRWLGQAILTRTHGDFVLLHHEFFRKGIAPGPVTGDDLYKIMQPRYCRSLVAVKLNGAQLKQVFDLCVGQRHEHLFGPSGNDPLSAQPIASNLDPKREYTLICLQSHLQPPPKHDISIKPLLEEVKVSWTVEPYTVLDAAKEFAKSQKVLQAPAP
jgi:5'-nucleotidase